MSKKKKKFSPVRVKDPCAENHMVRLCPNQEFSLVVSSYNKDVQVAVTSDYFRMTHEESGKDGSRIFYFAQIYDLSDWAKISQVYLGEVSLFTKDTFSSLCVVLDTRDAFQPDVVTVINPIGNELKIESHQVLEVVLYDEDISNLDAWKCEIVKGEDSIELEQFAHEVCYPHVRYHSYIRSHEKKDVAIILPRCQETKVTKEHHFFFRFNWESLSRFPSMCMGTHSAGKIIFEAEGDTRHQAFHHIINLTLNLRAKHRKRCFKVLFFPKRFQTVSSPSMITMAKDNPRPTYSTYTPAPKPHTRPKQRTFYYDEDDYDGYYYYGGRSLWIPAVKLKKKEGSTFGTGCRVAYCMKTVVKKEKKEK